MFWKDKPDIRLAEESDIKWFFVAKKYLGEEVEADFKDHVHQALANYQETLVIEDRNQKFGKKFGPVGMVAGLTNGYLYQPHVEWFPWATSQNKLRGAVAFFQKFRYRNLGVIRVHSPDQDFYKRLRKYVPLYYVGKVPSGDEFARGDDHIFFMKCRGAHGRDS